MEQTQTPISIIPNAAGELGILTAVNEAMALVEAVGKDGYHEGGKAGNYTYRSTDAVWTAISGPLAQAGIVVIPHSHPITAETVITTGWGDKQTSVLGVVSMQRCNFIIAARDGSRIETSIDIAVPPSKPQNNGAALAYASKYVLSQLLAIPFHDTETEVDHNDYKPAKATAPRRQPTRSAGDIAAETADQPHIADGTPKPSNVSTSTKKNTGKVVPADPKPQAKPDEVNALLKRLQASSDDVKEAFRQESKTQIEQGNSWSFKSEHSWSQTELDAAESFLTGLETTTTKSANRTKALARISSAVKRFNWDWDDILINANEHNVFGSDPVDTQDEALTDERFIIWMGAKVARAEAAELTAS